MPFTLAHPVAVVPLARHLGRLGVFSALVIGSLTPDLPYFVPLGAWGATSHTFLGLLLFDLPAGLAAYALFYFVLKQPLRNLLPARVQARLGTPQKLPAPAAVAISVAVGAATHLGWDSFTHNSGWVVGSVPSLRQSLFAVGDYTVFVYQVLQHGSTVVAALLLAWWFLLWFRTTAPAPAVQPEIPFTPRLFITAAILISAAGPAVIAAAASLDPELTVSAIRVATGRAARTGLSAMGAAILVFSLAWHARAISAR